MAEVEEGVAVEATIEGAEEGKYHPSIIMYTSQQKKLEINVG